MSFITTLDNTVRQYANKIAIVMGEQRISYAEMDKASNRIANALREMGVKKGDRVAMLVPNRPEFAMIFFGIMKLGGIAVPLDVRYHIDELSRIFNNCTPRVLIGENSYLEPVIPVLSRLDSIKHVIDLDASNTGKVVAYQDIIATYPANEINELITPDDLAVISYTGGPTTHPHGAALSHRSLTAEASMSADGFQQTEKDIMLLFALPMFHMFGLASAFLGSINRGSTVIIVPGTGISINSLMESIEKERGTILLGVPYIFALTIKLAKREGITSDLSSLRLCGSGGAPLPISTIRQFKKYYGLTISDIWGLTESVSHVTIQPIDGSGTIGASGKPLPGWEIRIVDDNDNELPPNKSGEIIVGGPFMNGFYNNPEATAEVIKNGWLHTGDIGKIDKAGYMYITGRKKRLIILKGQNIYPDDIEKILLTNPKISDVLVIGIPDELRGEIVSAFIKLKEEQVATEQEIRHFCYERMADYKIPKQIIFTGAIPEIATSNILWKDLKRQLADLALLFNEKK